MSLSNASITDTSTPFADTIYVINPFVNHNGLCWTMAFAYMFADKDKQDEIDHILSGSDDEHF